MMFTKETGISFVIQASVLSLSLDSISLDCSIPRANLTLKTGDGGVSTVMVYEEVPIKKLLKLEAPTLYDIPMTYKEGFLFVTGIPTLQNNLDDPNRHNIAGSMNKPTRN